ncbi:hypothetical protein IU443_04935 [Nocardia farcinica]|uniref:Uncharacterized protein n=2 Tax=Nocardia farcinica TaxID=37329 RepID=Q5YXB2_NOCFA|nr:MULTISPECIES: hypothetical protein [Nocardia]BAD57179.1 hypothetical protein NFA_23320 [Nocardia farcinica IFM 10152]MBA4855536.1 hypothetical protein [Nocardia farcinica]MBC9818125.1 hypothetical protein [Nocardia farcinica]MBF6067832.1 hypothetical protein [Nocardia farcinica]MBF6184623.1 hypothetical protein [Nocardia farcinica]
MVTIAQLRAVLAILRVDPQESVAAHRDPASEQAELVGLLHRVVSGELRQVLTADPAHPLAEVGAVLDESPTEQVCFEACLLHDHIDALAGAATADPAPVLLDAAARSADAAAALLALSRRPAGELADGWWQRALTDLGEAYHLINDEYVGRSNTVTAPLR